MSALDPECGSRLRRNSIPAADCHTGSSVVPFEIDVASSDFDLPLVADTGVVGAVNDLNVKKFLALQPKERLPCAEMGIRVSKDFKVSIGQPIVAQSAVQDLEVSLTEAGAVGTEIVDAAKVCKGVVGRFSNGMLMFCPLRGAGVIELCVDQAAGGNGEKCQKCKSFHRMSLGCQLMAMVSALVATVNPSKMNTAGGGVPSVVDADRGQACLQQVAPNPSLSNLGRVGATCAARPAFWEAFHG